MPSFDDHTYVLNLLTTSQDADKDNRQKSREAHLFLDKRDGQWEPFWWDASDGKPRYTFDQANPIIDQIAGEMEQADFDIKVKPSGGSATKDVAATLDGLIRNIENMSNASHVYNQAGRSMVTGGIDGWEVVQKFVDDDSFDQDLMIEPVGNFTDRVWYDIDAERQDRSDAKYAFKLTALSPEKYKEKFPEGSGQSVSDDRRANAYWQKAEMIVVGQFYMIKQTMRTLVLMSNGAVYEENDDFKKVVDELEAIGVTVKDTRKRPKNTVWVRKFDGDDWLAEEEETVFSYIPLIPTYANFKLFENKTIYWGAVEKILDPCRVFNYAKSREIEEGSLAPRAKWWLTETQAIGHEDELSSLNTNSEAYQIYNADPEAPGAPQQNGGAIINAGLVTLAESMRSLVGQQAGMFAASMGDNPGLQSGVAIEKLQNKGDTGTIKYFSSQEVAICHTAKILIDAIPAVYEGERVVRILKEDNSFDMITLNQQVLDEESGEMVTLNDLSQGKYDVTCSAGPSFQNRQQETVSAIVEMAQVDPSIIQLGGDVLLGNVTAPGMDLIAERKRAELFKAGLIPDDQMTEEEIQQVQAASQQPPQEDPNLLIGKAEMLKAETAAEQSEIDARLKMRDQDIKLKEIEARETGGLISAQQKEQEFELKIEERQQDLILAMQEQNRKDNETLVNALNTQADTLNKLREAMGVETIVGPHNQEAYINQAVAITENQEQLGIDTSIGEGVTGQS